MTQLEPHATRRTRPTPTDPHVEHRARLAVCAHATGPDDARELLEALGLVSGGRVASPGRSVEVGTLWRD